MYRTRIVARDQSLTIYLSRKNSMKILSNEEFAKEVMKIELQEFKPSAIYIPEGDCIEWVFSDDDYYGKRMNNNLTVYYSHKNDEIVGCNISEIQGLRRNWGLPPDTPIKLEYVFIVIRRSHKLTFTKTFNERGHQDWYQTLRSSARKYNIEIMLISPPPQKYDVKIL